ncbi:inositol oxygenase [Rhincodon typus]|uniref:inositol oxygenase n=1 Tax=Rhincodon typus TaxID=259920 RepID=UPI00202DD8A0|nr:inositol oxygenase [Rhincodon typus]
MTIRQPQTNLKLTEPSGLDCGRTTAWTNTKNLATYRNFKSGLLQERVLNTYWLMHTNQTVEFVKKKIKHVSLSSSFYGMYEPNCGLDKVLMSWGHDEYLYNVLKTNGCKLPEEGLYMIRFHSFYPWHTEGDYTHLCNSKDLQMLPWVKEFNKFDLYTKCDDLPDMKTLQAYYQQLIDKYCPGKLHW